MVSMILLSAGMSSRFGAPKALAPIKGKTTVIAGILHMLVESAVDEIIVVLGADADLIKPALLKHKKVKVVYNKDHKFGQTSSFKTGVLSVNRRCRAVLLLPVDFPLIDKKTIDFLVESFRKNQADIIIPAYQGRKGHPPLFSAQLFKEFLSLDNETGINEVAKRHPEKVVEVEVNDAGIIKSFNTPAEFQKITQEQRERQVY